MIQSKQNLHWGSKFLQKSVNIGSAILNWFLASPSWYLVVPDGDARNWFSIADTIFTDVCKNWTLCHCKYHNILGIAKLSAGNPYWRGRLNTVDFLVRISLDWLLLKLQTFFITKQATLMRRSSVPSLPLQLVFRALPMPIVTTLCF
jgi:hypothetical protein